MTEAKHRRDWLPLLQGILPVNRAGAVRDALAGLQLAAMNIPQALGYTKIAGMPVVTGLYTLLLPTVAFAVFGSSRYLVVAADSATAAILAGSLSGMARPGSVQYVALAGMVALLAGVFLLLARILRLGFIADFLSQTVLVGFLTGVGFQVGIAVMGEMVGVPYQTHKTVLQVRELYHGLGQFHPATIVLSIAIIAMVLVLNRISPKFPSAMIAVAAAIAASKMWDFASHGIAIIGPVAGGLPHLSFPAVHMQETLQLVPVAASCFVMIVAQSAATARVYAVRHHQLVDENDDLIGLSVANVAAAFSGTFVVNGSPTQTAMVESSGARSQLAQVTTAIVAALVLLFLTAPVQFLPRCVLGAVVFLIAMRLVDLRGMLSIRRESPGEFILAAITAAVVVLVGVEQGIVVAMVLSLLRIVRHSYRPHTGVLVADGMNWDLLPVTPGACTEPGLAIYRFSASLFYANAGYFSQQIRELVSSKHSCLRWVIIDAAAIADMDYTAARVVGHLLKEMAAQGVSVGWVRAPQYLRADLKRHHLMEVIDPAMIFPRLHDALNAFAKLPAQLAAPTSV